MEHDDRAGSSALVDDDDDSPPRRPRVVKKSAPPPKKQKPKPKPVAKKQPPAAQPNGWRRLLQTVPVKDKQGNVVARKSIPNLFNVAVILVHHQLWRDVIVYDEFGEAIIKKKRPPTAAPLAKAPTQLGQWTDADTESARIWFQAVENISINAADFNAALLTAARQNSRHDVREYLNEQKWDGEKRLETVFIDYFGVEDSPYVRGVTRMWFISAVARIMEPGCQADYAIILEGEQSLGKSKGLRALIPEGKRWFSETGIVLGNKDSYQNLHGVWIYCLDEMASVHGAEVRTMKNFITSPDDRYRPSYGRMPQNFPRQNVFICTVNPEPGGYFADRTGNRRFWPLVVLKAVDVTGLKKVRDQIWAEARKLYDKKMVEEVRPKKSRWWPDAEMQKLCSEQQRKRVYVDPWVDIGQAWLKKGALVRDEMGSFTTQRIDVSRGLSTTEFAQHAIGLRPDQMNTGTAIKAARVLRELGFDGRAYQETHGGVRDRYYKPSALRVVGSAESSVQPNRSK
jgi:predicted P-loop ATPase